jgi:alpha-ketoglutarate-dependent taurine dioxygenase
MDKQMNATALSNNLSQLATEPTDGSIKYSYFDSGPLPLVIEPTTKIEAGKWASQNRGFIEAQLLKHGAILFRNFGIETAADFEQFMAAACEEVMEYRERSSPRSEVHNRIYTSTDYPANQSIFPHNEHSYSRTVPLRICFFCHLPAKQGGETPIADCRKIFKRLPRELVERFLEKKWMYMRNFGDGFGLSWQTTFQSVDRKVVEDYCRSGDIEFEWKDGDRLRTRQVRPAVAVHPQTDEMVWFNHATFFHVTTLEPAIRDALLGLFKEEDLPNNTYYGDGNPIEPLVLDTLRQAYIDETISFPWQQGDMLLLDNMLTAHARRPFVEPRQVLVAMAKPYTRTDF